MTRFVLLIWIAGLAWPQSNIDGAATLDLVEGTTNCGGRGRLVHVYADISGLTGQGGLAGLQGYAIRFHKSVPSVFVSQRIVNGNGVMWSSYTHGDTRGVQQWGVVGWHTQAHAPNGIYHLMTLTLTGVVGPVQLDITAHQSSLSSKRVQGFGPDAIALLQPASLNTTIPLSLDLSMSVGVQLWGMDDDLYNMVDPDGFIAVTDLVQLVNCGG